MKTFLPICIVLFSFCLFSCQKDIQTSDNTNAMPIPVALKINDTTSQLFSDAESLISRMDMYIFIKLSSDSEYTFEKRVENFSFDQSVYSFQLLGKFPRKCYFIANNLTGKISYLNNINSTTTSTDFEANCLLKEIAIPQSPFLMTTQTEINQLTENNQIDVNLSFSLAKININYKYYGFTPDSIIIRSAIPATYLFNTSIPNENDVPRQDIRYAAKEPIYMSPNNQSTLTIYGKYDGIKTVLDIPLNEIKKSTQYTVTVRGLNDSQLNYGKNFSYEIQKWYMGNIIESQPE